jgi:hypothetical protein
MHTDGWRPVELEDGSSSSSDPEDQVLTECGCKREEMACSPGSFPTRNKVDFQDFQDG